jgi:hypothetical protein
MCYWTLLERVGWRAGRHPLRQTTALDFLEIFGILKNAFGTSRKLDLKTLARHDYREGAGANRLRAADPVRWPALEVHQRKNPDGIPSNAIQNPIWEPAQ